LIKWIKAVITVG